MSNDYPTGKFIGVYKNKKVLDYIQRKTKQKVKLKIRGWVNKNDLQKVTNYTTPVHKFMFGANKSYPQGKKL